MADVDFGKLINHAVLERVKFAIASHSSELMLSSANIDVQSYVDNVTRSLVIQLEARIAGKTHDRVVEGGELVPLTALDHVKKSLGDRLVSLNNRVASGRLGRSRAWKAINAWLSSRLAHKTRTIPTIVRETRLCPHFQIDRGHGALHVAWLLDAEQLRWEGRGDLVEALRAVLDAVDKHVMRIVQVPDEMPEFFPDGRTADFSRAIVLARRALRRS